MKGPQTCCPEWLTSPRHQLFRAGDAEGKGWLTQGQEWGECHCEVMLMSVVVVVAARAAGCAANGDPAVLRCCGRRV